MTTAIIAIQPDYDILASELPRERLLIRFSDKARLSDIEHACDFATSGNWDATGLLPKATAMENRASRQWRRAKDSRSESNPG